ncbi:MAG: hypothetical protein HHAS10_02690 [Candidatus Altimarinota bacterium]
MAAEGIDQSRLEQQNQRILDAISKSDIKPEDIDQISTELSSPDKIKEIRDATKEALRKAWETLSQKKGPLTPREQKIIDLYNRLFSAELIQKTLVATNTPSESLKGIIKPDGTLDSDAIKDLSPDQIREKIGKLNKADVKKLLTSLDKIDNSLLKNTVMQVVTPFIETMLQNGFSLETQDDIAFLEKNGSEKTKTAIAAWKKGAGDDPFKDGKKYIIKGEKILPLSNEKGELTTAGIDISKINTVDPKAGAEQLKKQLPPNFDRAKFGEFVNNLLKSDSKIFKGIGDILKIFGALLGIDFGQKIETGKEKPLDKKEKIALLKDMLNPANGRYNLSSGTINYASEGGQKFLEDIGKLGFGEGLPDKGPDGKYTYSQKLIKAVSEFSTKLGISPAVEILNEEGLKKILAKLESSTDQNPQQQPPAPAERTPEKPTRHPLADKFERFKDLTDKNQILALGRTIRNEIGGVDAVIRLQEELGFKKKPGKGEQKADGIIGEKTVAAYRDKYPEGNIPKPPAK